MVHSLFEKISCLNQFLKAFPSVLNIQATSYIVDLEDSAEKSDSAPAPSSAPAQALTTSSQDSAGHAATNAPKTKEFHKTTHSRKTTLKAKTKLSPKTTVDPAYATAEDTSSAGAKKCIASVLPLLFTQTIFM